MLPVGISPPRYQDTVLSQLTQVTRRVIGWWWTVSNGFAGRNAGRLVVILAIVAWVQGSPEALAVSKNTQPPTATRDLAYWPFETLSPWNHPVGSGTIYEPETMPRWDVSRGGYANIEGYSIPTYVATTADPLRRIYNRQSGPFPGGLVGTIRVPDSAEPAWGTDGHMNVVDETHAWVSEMYIVQRLSSSDISTLGYNKNSLRGLGGGFAGWQGSVAAGTSGLGGMIRAGELVNGTGGSGTGIRHALQGIVYPKALNRNAPGGRSWVWPASSSDPTSGYDVVGNVHMGSLLAIPPWVNINTLGITNTQALEVARAMQDYGIYLVDTGGVSANQLVIRIDPQAKTDIGNRTTFEAGISLAMRQLQVVTNSHANGGAPTIPGGGGTPRRPLAPPFTAPGTVR